MRHFVKMTAASALAIAVVASGCAYDVLFWERNIWQDTMGIFTLVQPADMKLYRELLPEQFSVPDEPMVGIYVVHFVDTEPWPMTFTEFLFPYFEASVFLRCDFQGQTGWYSHVMPVSSKAAMIGGHRLGFPKYVADEISVEQIQDGWLGAVTHGGRNQILLRFDATSVNVFGPLTPIQDDFVNGRGDANLEGPVILLEPPGEGPKVNVIPTSPPPRVEIESGTVEINLTEPYDGLVPPGTVAPGLYQRFTLENSGPPWIVVILFFVALAWIAWFLFRRWRGLRVARSG